jgi:PAS domain-containing protein
MSTTSKRGLQKVKGASAQDASEHSHNILHILFALTSGADVHQCLHELGKVRFDVCADSVVTPEEFTGRLAAQYFDLIIAEYPNFSWLQTQVLDLLRQAKKDIPLIVLVRGMKRETAADLILKGAADCIDIENIGHLPVAAHRALNAKALRDQRDRAELHLKHSEARYRALTGNLNYGICRCDGAGSFLEGNEALISMLGYGSKEELLALDLVCHIFQNPSARAQLLCQKTSGAHIDPLEVDGKEKTLLP